MTRELEYLEEALIEAEEAARWYAQRNLTATPGIASELEAAAQEIAETGPKMVATVPCTMRRFHGLQFRGVTVVTPNTWPAFDHGTRRFLLRRFPFSLLYRVELTRLVIVAVAHAHR